MDFEEFLGRLDAFQRGREGNLPEDEVEQAIQSAAEWVWSSNPRLAEVRALLDDLSGLKIISRAVEQRPALLKGLAERIRCDYEGKLSELDTLLNEDAVKRDLAWLRIIRHLLE